jgi:hypothetical protein
VRRHRDGHDVLDASGPSRADEVVGGERSTGAGGTLLR